MNGILQQIRKLTAGHTAPFLADPELLRRFIANRDEAAFATLVERHGAMVLGICRRLLRHTQDAEDACQAVFLVLARKARSIRKQQSVASWLHGVAYHVATNLKRDLARRSARATAAPEPSKPDPTAEASWREVQAIIEEELARLPENHRAPLILCYVEGKTRDEAAQQLGWNDATLRGSLERGRNQLRVRLTRRGITPTTAGIAGALAANSATASVPATVVVTIVKTGLAYAVERSGAVAEGAPGLKAVALADAMLKSALVGKIKSAVVCMLITAACVGLSLSTSLLGTRVPSEERLNQAEVRRVDHLNPAQQQIPIVKNAPGEREPPRLRQRFLDLQPHATLKLTESFAEKENNLATLPTGEQTLSGVKFNIGEGLILLNHEERRAPRKVAGIKVDATFSRLYVLHATHWNKGDALVGHYVLNYEDNSQELIPIVCGKDVGNWWYHANERLPSHAAVGWKGENASAMKISQAKIRRNRSLGGEK